MKVFFEDKEVLLVEVKFFYEENNKFSLEKK